MMSDREGGGGGGEDGEENAFLGRFLTGDV